MESLASARSLSPSEEAYDSFQYENLSFPLTHPDWLSTIGWLHGLDAAPATSCRVLELGCGRGGNIVPWAALFPDSDFVGVDLAPSQIADGQRAVDALGLSNVTLVASDIRDVTVDAGGFDYVICHGVYSWVPPDVRTAILEISAQSLTENGLAYISYNALPGWHARGALRSMLRRVVPEGPAPEMARTARGFLSLLKRRTPESGPLAAWWWRELALLEMMSDRYLYFEYLVEHNDAFYLDDFLTDARGVGLRYVADSDLASRVPEELGAEGRAEVWELAGDPVTAEMLSDYLVTRLFHRSVLCRIEASLERNPSPDLVRALWIGGGGDDDVEIDLGPQVRVDGSGEDEVVLAPAATIEQTIRWVLADAGTGGLAVPDVVAEVRLRRASPDDGDDSEVLAVILDWVLRGQVRSGRWRRPLAREIPEHPVAPRLARWQALDDREGVTTLFHDRVAIDPLDRLLLEVLDGELDLVGLLAVVARAMGEGQIQIAVGDEPLTDPDHLAEIVTVKLHHFARVGLIVDSEHALDHARPVRFESEV